MGLLGSNPVGWAAVGTATIAIGVGTLASVTFDFLYDTNKFSVKIKVDKVGHGLSWTSNKIKDGASWTKDKAGEAIQATKDKAKQETRSIIKGVGEAFKEGPSSIKPKMNRGWN